MLTDTYIAKTILEKGYHLPDKWISRLGGPDKVEMNPHYQRAAPMKLWRKDRVMVPMKLRQSSLKTNPVSQTHLSKKMTA